VEESSEGHSSTVLAPENKNPMDSSVGIATTLRVGRPGSIPSRGWEFFSSPPRPDRPWGPPNLPSNGYRGLFPPAGAWSLVKYRIRLHDVVLSSAQGHLYTLKRRLDWPKSRTGSVGEKKCVCLCQNSNSGRFAASQTSRSTRQIGEWLAWTCWRSEKCLSLPGNEARPPVTLF
jgi:hypothetical protein